jgi:hypothetical protein
MACTSTKLDSSTQTAGDIAKLYWDARFLMSWMPSNGRQSEEEEDTFIFTCVHKPAEVVDLHHA